MYMSTFSPASETFTLPYSGEPIPPSAEVVAEQTRRDEALRTRATRMLEDMDATTSREYRRFSAQNATNAMNRAEGWLDQKAQASAQKSLDKSEEAGRSEKSANRRARSREMLVKSSAHIAIGSGALLGTILTGGGSVLVAGAYGARLVARTSRVGYQEAQAAEKGEDPNVLKLTGKRWTDRALKAHHRFEYLGRKTQEKILSAGRNEGDPLSARRELTARVARSAVTGATMFGIGKGIRAAATMMDHFATGTAEARPTEAAASSATEEEKPARKDTDKAYDRSEAHVKNRQETEGLFDGTERTSKETDAHVLHKVENNPELMAEVLEVRESGNKAFSVDDVNKDIDSYTKGADYGDYSATGEKAVNTLQKSWENGKQGKILSENQANKLLDKYNLINHGTRNGAGANDEVFSAGRFDYRPELGDKIYAKELGNGRTAFFKVNERDPSRDCLNCLTIEEKPVVVETPPADVPEKQPPTDSIETKPPTDEIETPPPTQPPVDTPPPTRPPTQPPTNKPKDPTTDINANPDLPEQVQMGDQAGTIPAGEVTVPTTPPPVYEAPAPPAPIPAPAPPAPVEVPAPTPTNPGGTVAAP